MHVGPSKRQFIESTTTDDQDPSSSSVQSHDGDSSLILRIKRKRGADPISALRIESLLADGKANEIDGEALSSKEHVLAEEPRKRQLTHRGVFRLAETVSAASFANPEAALSLEQRLAEKKKHVLANKAAEKDDNSAVAKPAIDQKKSSAETSALRFKIVKPINKNLGIKNVVGLQRKGSSGSLKDKAVYGGKARAASRSSPRIASKGIESPGSIGGSPLVNRVRFVDAVIDDLEHKKESTFEGNRGKARHPLIRKKLSTSGKEAHDGDVEMAALDRRFADLLGNYLKENDLDPPLDLYDSVDSSPQQDVSSEEADSEDEYVYDIYFREKESMWGSGPAGASDAGLIPAEVAGHDEMSKKAIEAGPIIAAEPMATLIGFTEEDDIISEMENATKQMVQEVPNDSSDDFDEGEDEDSNDEGFYRNDYPEDEDAEHEEDVEQAGWGWSGPRRRKGGNSSDDDDDDDASEEDSEGY